MSMSALAVPDGIAALDEAVPDAIDIAGAEPDIDE